MVEGEPTTRIEGEAFDQPTEIELKDISSFDDLPKWTKPLQHGPFLNFREARKGGMESRYTQLTSKANIGKLDETDKKKYVEYLKKVQDLILNTPLDDMELPFATDFNNASFEDYVKGEKLTLNTLREKDFIRDTFQTKEQALSRNQKGARLTSALINPNKTNEVIDLELINKHIDTEWEDDKIIIRFDSLKYMNDLFDRVYDQKVFDLQTDDKKTITGQLAIEKDGELLDIPTSRLVITGGQDVPIGLVGSYIEGEGLSNNTVITRPKNKGKVEREGKTVQEYEYITVSPPKKDTESTEKNEYKLTVVHTNVNSVVGITDNRTKETTTKGSDEFQNYIYWLEIRNLSGTYEFMEDKDLYALYSAEKRKPVMDFASAEKMSEILDTDKLFEGNYVSVKSSRKPYKFKSMEEPIGAIIASSLKPRGQETRKQKIQVFDTIIPLGTIEIVLKTKLYEQIKALGGKKGRESKKKENPQVRVLIKDYKRYKDIIEAFDKAIKGGGDSPSSYRITNPRIQGPKQKDGKELGRLVEVESEYADPFTEFERMVPNATAEDFNDLLDIYEGSGSRGYRKGRDVYNIFLQMARQNITPEALETALKNREEIDVDVPPRQKVTTTGKTTSIGRKKINPTQTNTVIKPVGAIGALEELTEGKKEKAKVYSSSDYLMDFLTGDIVGLGIPSPEGFTQERIELKKRTPLISVESVNYEYRKQINLSGSREIAGKAKEDGKRKRYEIKGDKGKVGVLINGIKQFNRRLKQLDD